MTKNQIILTILVLCTQAIASMDEERTAYYKKLGERKAQEIAAKKYEKLVKNSIWQLNYEHDAAVKQLKHNLNKEDIWQAKNSLQYRPIAHKLELLIPNTQDTSTTYYADGKIRDNLKDVATIPNLKKRKDAVALLQAKLELEQNNTTHHIQALDCQTGLALLSDIKKHNAVYTIQNYVHKTAAQKIDAEIAIGQKNKALLQPKINTEVLAFVKAKEDAKKKERKEIVKKYIPQLTTNIINDIWPIIDQRKNTIIQQQKNDKEQEQKLEAALKLKEKKSRQAQNKLAKKSDQTTDESASPTTVKAVHASEEAKEQTSVVPANIPEYDRYIDWTNMIDDITQKATQGKEAQRIKNLKALCKCKPEEREKKKKQLNQQLEANFYLDFVDHTKAQTVLEEYAQALNNPNLSLDLLLKQQEKLIHANQQLSQPITWHLAKNKELYDKIKSNYLKIQASPQLSQASQQLKFMHDFNGVLDITKLQYPPSTHVDLQQLGSISAETLTYAEEEMTSRLLSQNQYRTNFQAIAPTITDLLQQADVDSSFSTVNTIIQTAGEIALDPKSKNSPDNFLEPIQQSIFKNLQRKNELSVHPATTNQIADKVKIHTSVIQAILNTIKKQP